MTASAQNVSRTNNSFHVYLAAVEIPNSKKSNKLKKTRTAIVFQQIIKDAPTCKPEASQSPPIVRNSPELKSPVLNVPLTHERRVVDWIQELAGLGKITGLCQQLLQLNSTPGSGRDYLLGTRSKLESKQTYLKQKIEQTLSQIFNPNVSFHLKSDGPKVLSGFTTPSGPDRILAHAHCLACRLQTKLHEHDLAGDQNRSAIELTALLIALKYDLHESYYCSDYLQDLKNTIWIFNTVTPFGVKELKSMESSFLELIDYKLRFEPPYMELWLASLKGEFQNIETDPLSKAKLQQMHRHYQADLQALIQSEQWCEMKKFEYEQEKQTHAAPFRKMIYDNALFNFQLSKAEYCWNYSYQRLYAEMLFCLPTANSSNLEEAEERVREINKAYYTLLESSRDGLLVTYSPQKGLEEFQNGIIACTSSQNEAIQEIEKIVETIKIVTLDYQIAQASLSTFLRMCQSSTDQSKINAFNRDIESETTALAQIIDKHNLLIITLKNRLSDFTSLPILTLKLSFAQRELHFLQSITPAEIRDHAKKLKAAQEKYASAYDIVSQCCLALSRMDI